MKIHAIQTGTVMVKTAQVEGVGHGNRRLLNTLIDRKWTQSYPIYAFAIEHPEGVIVVDTGETALAAQPGYFPWWHPYYRFGLRMSVEPEDEIGPQLATIGIRESDVRWLVLTHLHTDHAGGLQHLPKAEILVSRSELIRAGGRRGPMLGYMNLKFPSWFDPAGIEIPNKPLGPFPQSLQLTTAGDVSLVSLPGHTPGQIGVIVREEGQNVLLAGDASYSQPLLLRGVVDGVAPDERSYKLTQERIREYAATTPTVYLVAHDPETSSRLADRQVINLGREQSS